MYDIISNIINHSWATSTGEQSYVYYICGALICLVVCVMVDLVYRIFRNFWR